MTERARIFIIEDDKKFLESQKRVFELIGDFSVVGTASTFNEAKNKIPEFDTLGVQVVTLDRSLCEDGSGNEGDSLAQTIREQYPHLVLIGLSSYHFPEGLVDYDQTKKGSSEELIEYIKNLP